MVKIGKYNYEKSNRKNKKLMTIVDGKKIHFGNPSYQQYFDKTGIWKSLDHGDKERRKVIALRLGESMPMSWQWYHRSEQVGEPFSFVFRSGDLYLMSERAVGNDWRKSSLYTMRHAAGAEKYRVIRPKKK